MAIAAIMTLRAGARPIRVADAKYIFASPSSRTVANASQWYRGRYPHGLEPIVHFRSVTNAAWFLNPADASDVPMHELVAVCAAVLQPSVDVWSRFVTHLDKMVSAGELSEDESIAMVASAFTRIELADLGSDEDVEATTVREIVERVRAEEQTQFSSKLDEERKRRQESDKSGCCRRFETAAIKCTARAQVEKLATLAAGTIYGTLLVILALGAFLTLPTNWSNSTRGDELWGILWWGCVVVFFGSSFTG